MPGDASRHDRGWVAATLAAPPVDPLVVAGARGGLSVYWEQPSEGQAAAGFGVAGVEESSDRTSTLALLSRLSRDEDLRWEAEGGPRPFGPWFGGVAFDLARPPGDGWRGFPPARWILPELLVWRQGLQTWLTGFAPVGADPAAAAQQLRQRLLAAREQLPGGHREPCGSPRALEIQADPDAWRRLVEASLAVIRSGALSKVVAARAIEVRADADFEPLPILARLRAAAPGCTTFLFQGTGRAAFLGATPERLCRVAGGALETESLAGSASPGDPGAWLKRDKERREHGAVTDAILEGLEPLCESIEVAPAPSVMALPNVTHLRTPIRARLRRGAGSAQVVEALHPTPAVGGTPRERALAFLREHEGLDRGWYAGVVGWIGAAGAELRVGLRSALIEARSARLFVGAGLVAGSTVEDEWRETEAKSRLMLDALRGTPCPQ